LGFAIQGPEAPGKAADGVAAALAHHGSGGGGGVGAGRGVRM